VLNPPWRQNLTRDCNQLRQATSKPPTGSPNAAAAAPKPAAAAPKAAAAAPAAAPRRSAPARAEALSPSGRAIRGSRATAEARLVALRAEEEDEKCSDTSDFVTSDDESDKEEGRRTRGPVRRSGRRAAPAREAVEDSDGDNSLTESDSEDDEAAMVLDSDGDDDAADGPSESESESEEEDLIRPVGKRAAAQPAKPPAAKKAKPAPAPARAPTPVPDADDDDVEADDEAPVALETQTPKPKKAAAAKGAAAKKAPKAAAAKKGKGPTAVEDGDQEATFANVDAGLWAEEESVLPSPMPTRLAVLELFAGCGGLHLEGGVSFGADGDQLSMHTLAAVEIEEDPAQTYKLNHPSVNVMQMGVGRFLGTARRLDNLKKGVLPAPAGEIREKIRVTSLRVDVSLALLPAAAENGKKYRSLARQDKDSITVEAARGERPLAWLLFRVHTSDTAAAGEEPEWRADADTPAMRAAVHAYLNSDAFGPHVFPLPGDVHVVTGGPPCQGWSGYNTTRVTSRDIMVLMAHKENRLLGRFMEVVWFYRPMYVVMEEVPDVAKKPEVMQWMQMVLQNKGYNMTYEKRLRTGMYGCPQTRDRLIVLGAMCGLPHPAMPLSLTAPHARESDHVQQAFDSSEAAYPITMRCHADGTVKEAATALRKVHEAELAKLDEELGEAYYTASAKLARELKLRKLPQYFPSDSPKKKPVPRKKPGAAGEEPAPEPDAAERLRNAAAAAAKAAEEAAAAERAAAEEVRVAGLMRALVLGDAISADLPAEAEITGRSDREAPSGVRHAYLCDPPTPYIAYLRQEMPPGGMVSNHMVLHMKLTDHIRSQAIPYHAETCWRDMMGLSGSMYEPHMALLTDEEWLEEGAQAVRGIPRCMYNRQYDFKPKSKAKGAVKDVTPAVIPPLLHGWKLEKNRVPLVPFWCMSMKKGKDKACYGRLSYTEPHDTVHSYALPHWHVSLLPTAPRCLSVREKARVQGFPDSFVFVGCGKSQFKQIANAVSPQLGKAIGRSLLLALHGARLDTEELSDGSREAADAVAPCFTQPLRNFEEFLADFDESSLPKVNRPTPVPLPARATEPMTYEEMVVAYRTNTRTDHSVRYEAMTPFGVLQLCEENHSWHLEDFVGIRRLQSTGPASVQIAAKFSGFDDPEWLELGKNKTSWLWTKFRTRFKARVDEVLMGTHAYWCLPGVDPKGPDAPKSPEYEAARAQIEAYDERYREELDKEWHFRVGPMTKKAKRFAAKAKEEEPDMETMEEPDEYDDEAPDAEDAAELSDDKAADDEAAPMDEQE